jgi:tyrosyl-tRNA synthetase
LLQVLEGVPTIHVEKSQLDNGSDLVNFLTETGIFTSKSEARKMWQNGGIRINKKKVETNYTHITPNDLLQDKYLLIQKGKKNYYLIVAN